MKLSGSLRYIDVLLASYKIFIHKIRQVIDKLLHAITKANRGMKSLYPAVALKIILFSKNGQPYLSMRVPFWSLVITLVYP